MWYVANILDRVTTFRSPLPGILRSINPSHGSAIAYNILNFESRRVYLLRLSEKENVTQ